MSEPTIKGRPFVITPPDRHGWCQIAAADGSDEYVTVNGNWRAPPAPLDDLFFYQPPDKAEAFAAGQCDSGLVAELLSDRETLRQRLASVCGALADAGDVVFSVENPGEAVRELVERRAALTKDWNWVCRKLKVPDGTQLVSGSPTVAGELHVLESRAFGYVRYIEAHKCDDKEGEIARQGVEIEALRAQLTAEREKRAALVAEWRAADERDPWSNGYAKAADQLAALDKPEGA